MPRGSRIAAFVLGALVVAGAVAWAEDFPALRARYERERGKDFQTRYATLNEIAALDTVEALRFLEVVSRDDKDPSIRVNGLYAIARVKVPEAAEALLRAYRDGDPGHRPSILAAWTSYRHEALPAAIGDEASAGWDASARSSIVRYLADLGDPRFVAQAKRFLAEFPQSATSITSTLTQHPSPETARMLIDAYDDGRAYDRDTVPAFFAAAAPEVKVVLTGAIAAGRDPALERAARIAARARLAEAEEPLVAAARAAKTDERRATFLEAVGKVGLATPSGRALALEALGSAQEIVAVAGVRALRGRVPVDAIPRLIELLGAKAEALRAEARITLERATGQQFGLRLDLWEAWWRTYGPTFDPAQVKAPEGATLDQALVDLALAKGAAALRALAVKDPKGAKGPWEYAGHPVGTTALVLLALHAAGGDARDPVAAAALRWLVEQPVPSSTYDAGLVAMTLEAVGGRKHRAKIAEAAKQLIATQNAGGFWGYPSGAGDHSNTQYALLGLRHAVRAGVAVPPRTWRAAHAHWLATQNDDGGWTYVPQSSKDVSIASMTAAGVACLLIGVENGDLDEATRTTTAAAVERGFAALGRIARFDKDGLYALYGIERAGMLGKRTMLGTTPWYVPGATRLLAEQGRDGCWAGSYDRAVDTAFGVLFLKKATAPIAGPTTR
jgi:hypothetical protein